MLIFLNSILFLALAFLTKKGYVHRDISPGNIIIYKGRAKLADLEFAEEYGTGSSNNIRIVSQSSYLVRFLISCCRVPIISWR